MIDPVFCLEGLERFEPTASFTMTAQIGQTEPHVTLVATMRSTANAAGWKGYGTWVRMDDVLRLMIALKDQSQKGVHDGQQ